MSLHSGNPLEVAAGSSSSLHFAGRCTVCFA